MKPNFALSLSYDGLNLLQRSGAFWISIGQINLSETDFDKRVYALRQQALEQSPHADIVKLVLPSDQIKFMSMSMSQDMSDENIDTIVRDEVTASTPYDLDEMVIDWIATKETVYIAVVARETLHEAEEFAYRHGFKPLGSIAAGTYPQFLGEAHFGLADGTYSTLDIENEIFQISASAIDYISYEAQRRFDANLSDNIASPADIVMRASAESRILSVERPPSALQIKKEQITNSPPNTNTPQNLSISADEKQPPVLRAEAGPVQSPQIGPEIGRPDTQIAAFPAYVSHEAASLNEIQTGLLKSFQLFPFNQVARLLDANKRLLRAGYLPIFALLILFLIVSSSALYIFGRPTMRNVTEKVIGPPSGPNLMSEIFSPVMPKRQETDYFAAIVIPEVVQPIVVEKPQTEQLTAFLDLPSLSKRVEAFPPHKPDSGHTAPSLPKSEITSHQIELAVTLPPEPIVSNARPDSELRRPNTPPLLPSVRRELERSYLETGIWAIGPTRPLRVRPVLSRLSTKTSSDPQISKKPYSGFKFN